MTVILLGFCDSVGAAISKLLAEPVIEVGFVVTLAPLTLTCRLLIVPLVASRKILTFTNSPDLTEVLQEPFFSTWNLRPGAWAKALLAWNSSEPATPVKNNKHTAVSMARRFSFWAIISCSPGS